MLLLPPAFGRVVAVPVILPEASRVTARSVPPACFWRSMVWTIRPEESRTTSRQVWAESMEARANGSRIERRREFMRAETDDGGPLFNSPEALIIPPCLSHPICHGGHSEHDTNFSFSGLEPWQPAVLPLI